MDNFLVDEQMTATQPSSARKDDVQFTFANPESRIYAAASYHDENRSSNFNAKFIELSGEV